MFPASWRRQAFTNTSPPSGRLAIRLVGAVHARAADTPTATVSTGAGATVAEGGGVTDAIGCG